MEYDDEFLEEIQNNVNLLEYAEATGFDFIHKGKENYCSCPLHRDDTPSLSISENDPTKFFCFSCHTGGGIIGWLCKIEHMKFDDAVEKAAQLANMNLADMCQSPVMMFLKKNRREKKNKVYIPQKHPIIPDCRWEEFKQSRIPEWEAEGIRRDILSGFDIRVDEKSNRIVYAVRDIDGKLINIKGRSRYKNYKQLGFAKYMNYFPVGDLDYFQSLDKALPYVKEKGEIIIGESIKSTMKCWTWGIKNVVSAETHAITDGQLRLLIKLKCDVVIAFDKDVNLRYGEKDKELREQINRLSRFVNVFYIKDNFGLLGQKDAPMDCGEETFSKLYSERLKWR